MTSIRRIESINQLNALRSLLKAEKDAYDGPDPSFPQWKMNPGYTSAHGRRNQLKNCQPNASIGRYLYQPHGWFKNGEYVEK